jgi:hypothetical protein
MQTGFFPEIACAGAGSDLRKGEGSLLPSKNFVMGKQAQSRQWYSVTKLM